MVRKLLITIALIAVLCGCNHKELCYKHPHTAIVAVHVDWQHFVHKEEPTGMTVILYPQNSTEDPVSTMSNNTRYAELEIPAGVYHSIVFNQSTSEFGTLEFRNMKSYNTAEVVAANAPTKWYTTRAEDEKIAHEPEWFGTHNFEGAELTEEMIQLNSGYYKTKFDTPDTPIDFVFHTPQNVIHTVEVTVHIKNVYNLKSARAALQGMAEGYMLGAAQPSSTTVTHLLEEWSLTVNKTDPTLGYIKAKLLCFGLPAGHTAQPQENIFNLNLLLVDNKTQLSIPFEVGDKFETQGDKSQLALHLELELKDPLPDVKPVGGSEGGFDATVEDWGEEIEHEVEI